jgi:hypothetical protein
MPTLLLVVGVAFGPIAAAMAFAITFEEWSRHRLSRPELIKRFAANGARYARAFRGAVARRRLLITSAIAPH